MELSEVEAVAREATGLDSIVAVGWPVTLSGYGGVEVFLEGVSSNPEAIRTAVASRLPEYMVPRRLHSFDRQPRDVNGKFDRRTMLKLLENGL